MTTVHIIQKDILKIILESPKRFTPIALEKMISQKFALEKRQAKTVISDLVTKGEITYIYQYGCTFLERSFNKPVHISKRVVLKPPEIDYTPRSEEVVINIRHGASFGTGQHPTTRLAIRGIEHALKDNAYIKDKKGNALLDIGTGSGVLAIAAVQMGIEKGIGIDIDPCSIAEARENIRINDLENRINISDQAVEEIHRSFSLIIANLRYPTLIRLFSHLTEITDPDGVIILSGIKADELEELLRVYTKKNFECRWQAVEKDWAGVVMKNASVSYLESEPVDKMIYLRL